MTAVAAVARICAESERQRNLMKQHSDPIFRKTYGALAPRINLHSTLSISDQIFHELAPMVKP